MGPVAGALVSGGLKLLGGLFGGGKKSPTPRKNMLSQAQGAREAAEQYGFNPLTMLQYGQPGGAMGAGGAPPLASSDLILGAMQDVSDVLTGETARRDAANKLELELGRRKIEAMSGLLAVAPSAAATVGDGLPTIGRRAAMAVTPSTQLRFPQVFNDQVSLQAGPDGGVASPAPRLDRGSGAFVNGWRLDSAPGWSPASVFENDYGDVGQAVYGLAKIPVDIAWSVTKPFNDAFSKYEKRPSTDKPDLHRSKPENENPWFGKKSPFRLFGTAAF